MKQAEVQDYVKIQGGMPSVSTKGKLTVIHHDYEAGQGMVVRSHKSIDEYGYVDLQTSASSTKRFKVALLRAFHGEPCEKVSLKTGGDGYERKRSSHE